MIYLNKYRRFTESSEDKISMIKSIYSILYKQVIVDISEYYYLGSNSIRVNIRFPFVVKIIVIYLNKYKRL